MNERLRGVQLPEPPEWMEGTDPLQAIWRAESDLLERGRIAPGYVFMANSTSFEPGEGDAPAGVVYTFDPLGRRFPGLLEAIGSRLYAFHDPEPAEIEGAVSPWLRLLLDMTASGMERPFHLRLPPELSAGVVAYTSAVMVFREHLADGFLTEHHVDVVVAPTPPRPALLVPTSR